MSHRFEGISPSAYMEENDRSCTLYSRGQEICVYLKSSGSIILRDGELSRITLKDLRLFMRRLSCHVTSYMSKKGFESLERNVPYTQFALFGIMSQREANVMRV